MVSSMKTNTRAHVIVHGAVQGVGFRYFTSNAARRFNVNGWVRNNPDGTVELEAEADRATVDEFLAFIEKGNSWAQVDELTVKWLQPEGYSGFDIEP